MRLRALVPVLLAASLLGVTGSAWGHDDAREPAFVPTPGDPVATPGRPTIASLVAASELPAPLWLLLALPGAAALARAGRRPARAAVVALALVVVAFAFEGARHSVHHGVDRAATAACATASLAAHADSSPVEPVAIEARTLGPTTVLREQDPLAPAGRPLAARLGRAPPSAHV